MLAVELVHAFLEFHSRNLLQVVEFLLAAGGDGGGKVAGGWAEWGRVQIGEAERD